MSAPFIPHSGPLGISNMVPTWCQALYYVYTGITCLMHTFIFFSNVLFMFSCFIIQTCVVNSDDPLSLLHNVQLPAVMFPPVAL